MQDQVERGAIAIGAVLTKTGDGTVDDAGVTLLRFFVTEAEAVQGADAEVLQHNIRFFNQLEKERLAFWLFQIDDDAALVAVDGDEVRIIRPRHRRTPGARKVACTGWFELDHVGAVVGEHGRAVRAGEGVGKVDNGDVV